MVSGAQVRAGRGLLGWTPRDLVRMANVGVFTVNQIELIEGPSRYPGLATIEATPGYLLGHSMTTSIWLTVETPTFAMRARSRAVHPSKARPSLTCAPETLRQWDVAQASPA